jgi:predicted amidohydrolase
VVFQENNKEFIISVTDGEKSMSRIVRVSSVQLPAIIAGESQKRKNEHNKENISSMLEEAGKRKSDIVLFGEYANLHHRSVSSDPHEYIAEDIPGEYAEIAAGYARKYSMNILLPVFGRYSGVVSSYVMIIDRNGELTDCYRKAHVTEAEQRLGMVPGNYLPVFELDCCRMGCMVCMDIEYPEVAQILMLKQAEILFFPHVQNSWGEIDWEIRYRARAIDTGLYVVSACYGYPEGEWDASKMVGRSGFIGRDGLIIAECGRGIGIVTADLDLDARRVTEFYFARKLDRTLAVQASRRPELYGALADLHYRDATLNRLSD